MIACNYLRFDLHSQIIFRNSTELEISGDISSRLPDAWIELVQGRILVRNLIHIPQAAKVNAKTHVCTGTCAQVCTYLTDRNEILLFERH